MQALAQTGRFEEARGFLRGWPDPAGYDRAYMSWALTFGGDVAAQRGARDEAEREYRRLEPVVARQPEPVTRLMSWSTRRELTARRLSVSEAPSSS